MPVRAIALILTCLAGSIATAEPALAQARYGIEIRMLGTDEHAQTFRRELETSLSEFVQTLPPGTRNALGVYRFADTPTGIRTLEDAREHWGDQVTTLVIIWGRVTTPGSGTNYLRTWGDVYVGFSNVPQIVRHPGEGYRRVLGQMGREGQAPRLELYQELVGYALLLRAWQRGLSREHINIIANQIELIPISALTAGSPCHASIRAAVRAIRRKAPLQPLAARRAQSPVHRAVCEAA